MSYESEQFVVRDQFLRNLNKQRNAKQRMEWLCQAQQAAFEQLKRNPEAFARFWKRNLRKRAVGYVS